MADARYLTIEAPEQVDAPLTVWDIAFASGQPDRELPDFVTEVGVTFEVPTTGDVDLAVDGPGVLSPLTTRTTCSPSWSTDAGSTYHLTVTRTGRSPSTTYNRPACTAA